jgi:lipid-A-disaccharide synthase
MISCADPSSLLYVKGLLRTLKEGERIKVFGFAQDVLHEDGVDVIQDLSPYSVVGLSRILQNAFHLFVALKKASLLIRRRRPKLLLLFDFPEFNMRLARFAKRYGVKIAYLFPPAVWAWRKGRAAEIASICDLIICAFPFEVELYRRFGGEAFFFGHPLCQMIKEKDGKKREEGLVIGLFPGSRKEEIKRLLPLMLEASSLLKERFHARIKIATIERNKDWIKELLDGEGVECEPSYKVMPSLDFAFVCSGTATLELALSSVPMLVLYKLDALSWFFAKRVVKTPFVSLPNIILKEPVYPEVLQHINVHTLVKIATRILFNEAERERMSEASCRIRKILHREDVLERMADSIFSLCKNG